MIIMVVVDVIIINIYAMSGFVAIVSFNASCIIIYSFYCIHTMAPSYTLDKLIEIIKADRNKFNSDKFRNDYIQKLRFVDPEVLENPIFDVFMEEVNITGKIDCLLIHKTQTNKSIFIAEHRNKKVKNQYKLTLRYNDKYSSRHLWLLDNLELV